MPDLINIRLTKDSPAVEAMEEAASKLGMSRNKMILKAIGMMISFDKVFYKKLEAYSEKMKVPMWTALQNMTTKRWAQDAVKASRAYTIARYGGYSDDIARGFQYGVKSGSLSRLLDYGFGSGFVERFGIYGDDGARRLLGVLGDLVNKYGDDAFRNLVNVSDNFSLEIAGWLSEYGDEVIGVCARYGDDGARALSKGIGPDLINRLADES